MVNYKNNSTAKFFITDNKKQIHSKSVTKIITWCNVWQSVQQQYFFSIRKLVYNPNSLFWPIARIFFEFLKGFDSCVSFNLSSKRVSRTSYSLLPLYNYIIQFFWVSQGLYPAYPFHTSPTPHLECSKTRRICLLNISFHLLALDFGHLCISQLLFLDLWHKLDLTRITPFFIGIYYIYIYTHT